MKPAWHRWWWWTCAVYHMVAGLWPVVTSQHTIHTTSHLLRPHLHFQGKIKKIDKFSLRSFLPFKIKRRMYKKERNVAMQHKFIQSNFQSNNFRNCEFLPSRNCTPQFHNNIPSESSKVQLKLPQVKNSRNLSRSIVHLASNSSSPTTLFPPTFPSRNPGSPPITPAV